MTGFATAARDIGALHLNLELRAVNHRYLDLQFRLPDELRHAESSLRETLVGRVHRGKVECRVQVVRNDAAAAAGSLNTEVIQKLLAAQTAVLELAPDSRPLSVHEALRWPGVIAESLVAPEELAAQLVAIMKVVALEFLASREREGAKLKAMLLERCVAMRALCIQMAPRIPELQKAYEAKLADRMREIGVGADPERIALELALFASKIDVAEELSRLGAHISEVERVLAAGGACGKRLDFLMQELNREANTFGSKSVDSELTRAAVEMKVLIEQMREQVQNIE
ncbi:MAG: YicC/YloC family endoribonuclease [Betaproteobacteria bacterium]